MDCVKDTIHCPDLNKWSGSKYEMDNAENGINYGVVESRSGQAVQAGTDGLWLPKWVAKPRKATLSELKWIQLAYLNNWIPAELFNEWYELNGGEYQVQGSKQAMKLWSEYTLFQRKAWKEKNDLNEHRGPAIQLARCKTHGHTIVRIIWRKVKGRPSVKSLNKIWRWSSSADKTKSQIDVASLIAKIKGKDQQDLIDAMLPYCSTDFKNVTVCAMLIHAIGNPHVELMLDCFRKYKRCCLNESDWVASMKAFSTAIRRNSRLVDGREIGVEEVASLAYWELAVGRSRNVTDWVDERSKRVGPRADLRLPNHDSTADESSNAVVIAELGIELDSIMRELIPQKLDVDSWQTYCEKRQSWVAGGSSGGAKWIVDGREERVNKHSYFETITTAEMTEWLNREPKIEGVASEKFEMGKSRAIYGTKPIDYSIMSYAIGRTEKRLWNVEGIEIGLQGIDEVRAILRKLDWMDQPGLECTMIDYADFNYQHTLEAQAEVFIALSRRYKALGMHEDTIKAADWCGKALLNQWVTFPGEGPVRCTQGMFSGVRGTNFLNTLLNVAYFRYCSRFVKENLGVVPINLYNVHQGDDVWISNQSRLWAVCLYTTAKAMGFIFQASKQMFGYQRGEFLRVLYGKECVKGYLARCVGTLIIKPIQGADQVGPAERAVGLNDQLHILLRRGIKVSAMETLWDCIIPFAASMRLVEEGFSIPRGILYKSYPDGGLDLGKPYTMALPGIPTAPIPQMVIGSRDLEKHVPTHMTDAWVREMSKQIGEQFDANHVRESIHRANVCDSLRPMDRERALRVLEHDLRKWRDGLMSKEGARCKELYTQFINNCKTSIPIEDILHNLDNVKYRKLSGVQRTDIDNLFAAITSSPFRDLGTARMALKLGVVEAAKRCVELCNNNALRLIASETLNTLLSRCGDDVTIRILLGIRMGTGSFTCEWHPIILSWLQKLALQQAVTEAVSYGIRDLRTWDKICGKWLSVVLSAANRRSRLAVASAY